MKQYYELISFSSEPNDITKSILKEIESKEKVFDYNFGREHCILYENTLVKDIFQYIFCICFPQKRSFHSFLQKYHRLLFRFPC